ncbi:hypothetical protein T11_17337, partial [Trichinella zimbabwensis]
MGPTARWNTKTSLLFLLLAYFACIDQKPLRACSAMQQLYCTMLLLVNTITILTSNNRSRTTDRQN